MKITIFNAFFTEKYINNTFKNETKFQNETSFIKFVVKNKSDKPITHITRFKTDNDKIFSEIEVICHL